METENRQTNIRYGMIFMLGGLQRLLFFCLEYITIGGAYTSGLHQFVNRTGCFSDRICFQHRFFCRCRDLCVGNCCPCFRHMCHRTSGCVDYSAPQRKHPAHLLRYRTKNPLDEIMQTKFVLCEFVTVKKKFLC